MIVKILRGSETTWYDCETARWIPRDIHQDPSLSTAVLVIDNGDERKMEEIECKIGNAVYFMSDSGQTVDSLRW